MALIIGQKAPAMGSTDEGTANESNDAAIVETEVAEEAFFISYIHRECARFKVDEFEFSNGLLNITDPEKNEKFKALILHKDFQAYDRQHIQEYNLNAAANLYKPITATTTKGTATSSSIPDKKLVQ